VYRTFDTHLEKLTCLAEKVKNEVKEAKELCIMHRGALAQSEAENARLLLANSRLSNEITTLVESEEKRIRDFRLID
jgi:hypothetical protein